MSEQTRNGLLTEAQEHQAKSDNEGDYAHDLRDLEEEMTTDRREELALAEAVFLDAPSATNFQRVNAAMTEWQKWTII